MRKLIVIFAAILLASCANAAGGGDSYLYWMIDAEQPSPVEFYLAMIYTEGADGNKEYLTVGSGEEEADFIGFEDADGNPIAVTEAHEGFYTKLPDDPESFSYFIELYDLDGNSLAWSRLVSYSEIMNNIYHDMSISGIENAYHFSASTRVVPEPTGGLLVLLGVGALALRRKRVA